MKSRHPFFAAVAQLAVPVALQSMLQASFSIVDQIMIGQLGSVSVAGVGLAGKFASLFSVVVSAVGAVAGIMISQYSGQAKPRELRRSFYLNLALSVGIGAVFTALCALFPANILCLYTADAATAQAGAEYLRIIAATYIPLAGATLLSTYFRCYDMPRLPLYASLASAVLNTGLNYILIFGKLGAPALGAVGAAIATAVSQLANVGIMLALLPGRAAVLSLSGTRGAAEAFDGAQYAAMLLPVLTCEALWSVGENVYAAIYGHMGTAASAAMTLINPVQGLLIGALCGLSQAAGVIIGKRLGRGEYDGAYAASRRLVLYGALGALALSAVVIITRGAYVRIFRVEAQVMELTRQILLAYALIAPFKVLNMILGGGILRSGGRTKYVMLIDLVGTWLFGVPLGLLGAFVLRLSVPYVYFLLSLEEVLRLAISLAVFRHKAWMQSL